jgi:hypothetical protein
MRLLPLVGSSEALNAPIADAPNLARILFQAEEETKGQASPMERMRELLRSLPTIEPEASLSSERDVLRLLLEVYAGNRSGVEECAKINDLAAALEVSRSAIVKWQKEERGFPKPVATRRRAQMFNVLEFLQWAMGSGKLQPGNINREKLVALLPERLHAALARGASEVDASEGDEMRLNPDDVYPKDGRFQVKKRPGRGRRRRAR